PGRSRRPRHQPSRARRRLRPDLPVELPDGDRQLEDRSGARLWEHRDPEARLTNAAHDPRGRRHPHGSRTPRGDAQRPSRPRLAARTDAIRVGSPLQETTEMGPLVSDGQRQTSLDYIEIGVKEGAKLVTGGDVPDGAGYFLRPCVLADVDNSWRVAREEIFGPVVTMIPFDTEDEAIRIAN